MKTILLHRILIINLFMLGFCIAAVGQITPQTFPLPGTDQTASTSPSATTESTSATQAASPSQSLIHASDSPALLDVINNSLSEIDGDPENTSSSGGVLHQIYKVWVVISIVINHPLFEISDSPLTLKKLFVAILIVIAGVWLADRLRLALRGLILRRTRINANTSAILEKLFYYTLILIILIFALDMIDIPLTVFAFLGGAVAIGVGFGAQQIFNNFISGIILMLERPIKIGDVVEIEGTQGNVEEIGLRCTRIRTGANIHLLVPNSKLLENNVTNWTHKDNRVRLVISIGIVYGSPTRQAKELIEKALRENERVMNDPAPNVIFSEFGDDALIFDVYFWSFIKVVFEGEIIKSELRFRIDDLFREANIVIAFPQRDVHLDTIKPLEVKVVKNEE